MLLPPCSIIEIFSSTHTNIFEGDILTRYGLEKNTNPNSPIKAHVVHADLVDKDVQMTITVNINNNLIPRFRDNFYLSNNVHIMNFLLKKKQTMVEEMQSIVSSYTKTLWFKRYYMFVTFVGWIQKQQYMTSLCQAITTPLVPL